MDFRHPFITNPRLAVYYALFWLVAAVANVLMLTLGSGEEVGTAILMVSTFIILYAIIGTAIWYVIKFSTLEDNSIPRIIFAHAIAASIIVFIWVYFGVVLIKLLHPNPETVSYTHLTLPTI